MLALSQKQARKLALYRSAARRIASTTRSMSMKTKALGTYHGAVTRARIETARTAVRTTATRCTRKGRQLAEYVTGFAQGLLRSPNA